MKLQELALKEDELYRRVGDLYQQQRDLGRLQDVFVEYRSVHQAYAELALTDPEALKRGLFLQWYSMAEPSYLTGISDLDGEAVKMTVLALNGFIQDGKVDDELKWMLNYYYAGWKWMVEEWLTPSAGFINSILHRGNNYLPENIDRRNMACRGQMGRYWNSLAKFGKPPG